MFRRTDLASRNHTRFLRVQGIGAFHLCWTLRQGLHPLARVEQRSERVRATCVLTDITNNTPTLSQHHHPSPPPPAQRTRARALTHTRTHAHTPSNPPRSNPGGQVLDLVWRVLYGGAPLNTRTDTTLPQTPPPTSTNLTPHPPSIYQSPPYNPPLRHHHYHKHLQRGGPRLLTPLPAFSPPSGMIEQTSVKSPSWTELRYQFPRGRPCLELGGFVATAFLSVWPLTFRVYG